MSSSTNFIPEEGLKTIKNKLYKQIEADFPKSYRLLYILSFAPAGLTMEEIHIFT